MSIIKEMSTKKLFSENTEYAINSFCENINNSDADVFIVMAQKAVCLFQLLLDEGKLDNNLSDKFVSSSALEYGTNEFVGKKIAIIDDIIISGSSLAGVINRLLDAGIPDTDLEIIAIVRNTDYQVMKFTYKDTGESMLNCCLEAKDAECIEISYDISHIFAYAGNPFDTDFPLYKSIEINKENWKKLLNSLCWETFEITNDINNCGNIESFVSFPKDCVLKELNDLIGVNITDLVHFKIRLYMKTYANKKCKLRVVPMALFNETTIDIIDELYNCFTTEELKTTFVNLSYLGKLGYLQFYFANTIQQIFIKQIKNDCFEYSPLFADVIFGHNNSNAVIKSLNYSKEKPSIFLNNLEIDFDDLGYEKTFDCSKIVEENDECGFVINEALFNAIKWWYEEHELVARNNMKDEEYHCINDYALISKNKIRLGKGFSFAALKNIVKDAGKYYKLDCLVSMFLDRGIDEGVVVPINCYDEERGLLYRAYRHGEDLPFGEADKARLIYFLMQLDNYFRDYNGKKEEKIASISFEKMIVLFYQLGLKSKHIFNRFLGFDNDPLLQQRFSVHGIVASVKMDVGENNESHIYISKESNNDITQMITKLFRKEKEEYINSYKIKGKVLFSVNNDNVYYYSQGSKLSNISEEIKDEIDTIASLIAKWYILETLDDGKDKFKDNIIALTSCKDIFTFSSSIATALHYFKNYWELEAKGDLISAVQGIDVDNISSEHLGQTLPSARKKHELFIDNGAKNTINYVKELFEKNKLNLEKNSWNNYFRRELTITNLGTNKHIELNNNALKYLYFYSECYEWLTKKTILLSKAIKNKTDFSKSKYYALYSEIQTNTQMRNLFDILYNAEKEDDSFVRINNFIKEMDLVIKKSEKLVDGIESCISEKSSEYTVEYNSAIIVDVHFETQQLANSFFRTVWNEIKDDSNRVLLNIVSLGSVEDFQRYGVFYEETTNKSNTYLLDVYNTILKLSSNYSSPTRTIFIPCFSEKIGFRHNLKTNISKHVADFLKDLNQYRSHIIFKEHFHQFFLFNTWDVEDEFIELLQKDLDQFSKQDEIIYDKELAFIPFFLGEEYKGFSKHLYSTVKIKVNSMFIATGVLLQHNGCIYCVSCQHILDEKNLENITANTSLDDLEMILKPLNYMKKEDRVNQIADNDILICKVEILNSKYLNNKYIFDKDDCECNLDVNSFYHLFGYDVTDHEIGKSIDNMNLVVDVAKGYIGFKKDDLVLEPGSSGSGIVLQNTNNLIGIHAQYNDELNKSLSIPIYRVINVLKKEK